MAKKVTKKSDAEQPAPQPVYHNEVDEAIEKRLVALYTLQRIDSKINEIRTIRGELPQAIADLEDELTGLQTRIDNFNKEVAANNEKISAGKAKIAESESRTAVLKEQQGSVRNNREYDSIQKELEYHELEMQLGERHIKDATARIKEINAHIEAAQLLIAERNNELATKKAELDDIVKETEEMEQSLLEKSSDQETYIDDRYLTAYKRIRNAAHNGLAVVKIDRDACGGCFSHIPPQRQMEIKMHKKVIVCEHCGRILVDNDIAEKSMAVLTINQVSM